jgi:hypothetical protein
MAIMAARRVIVDSTVGAVAKFSGKRLKDLFVNHYPPGKILAIPVYDCQEGKSTAYRLKVGSLKLEIKQETLCFSFRLELQDDPATAENLHYQYDRLLEDIAGEVAAEISKVLPAGREVSVSVMPVPTGTAIEPAQESTILVGGVIAIHDNADDDRCMF